MIMVRTGHTQHARRAVFSANVLDSLFCPTLCETIVRRKRNVSHVRQAPPEHHH